MELNLVSSDRELVDQLNEWFDGKWEQGQDCTEEFIERLEDCVLFGRRYTPWQVFLKSLHAAYGQFLDIGISEALAERLAGFQQHAVERCVTLIERHWGAMLCDSVGLGKTYEGLGILQEFAARREGSTRALVVCPAQLEANWSLDRLAEFRISGETVSMESLPQLVDLDEQDPLAQSRNGRRLRRYQDNFDIILVDESHNFRNPQTKRYRALMEMIRGGRPDKRVVLLTATPINNSIWDLYHQLMLITRGDDTWYAGRAPVQNLRETIQAAEDGTGGPGLLDVMLLSLVRRTRHDIRAQQAAGEPMDIAGEPLRFPEHEIPEAVGYSLQNLYGDIYRDVIDAIENLSFAVYQLENYGVRTGEFDTEGRVKQRNANFVGIMRTIFLKRMESSVVALTNTITSMVDYLNLFLTHLNDGKVISPKQARRLRDVLGGSLADVELDNDELPSRAASVVGAIHDAPEDAAQRDRLQADVEADRDRLTSVLTRFEWLQTLWGEDGDPKVQALRALLESLPATDQHGVPTKVVLFTNYQDTGNYLFEQFGGDQRELFDSVRVASNLSDERSMSILTGAATKPRRAQVLEHFAPLASHRSNEPLDDAGLADKIRPFRDESIELLIATDVLSEGQNLQDAQYLINYDLHWNPVRMIQRAGRIDRLFSPHERVYIYNLMPEQGLEEMLNLVGSLTQKLETIEDAMALDASVLGEQIEAKQFDAIMALRAGGEKADEIYLEGEKTQGLDAGLEVLNQYLDLMKEAATEEVEEIPNGVYSVREGRQPGVYVMLKMPEDASGEVFWRFYPAGDTSRPITSPNEVLSIIQATPDELRHALDPDENPFGQLAEPLRAAVDQIGDSYVQEMARQSPDAFIRRLRRVLQRDDVLEADEELWKRLSDWTEQPLPSDTPRRRSMRDAIRALNQLAADAPMATVLETLGALWTSIETEGLDRVLVRPDARQPTIQDLELVSWELVVSS